MEHPLLKIDTLIHIYKFHSTHIPKFHFKLWQTLKLTKLLRSEGESETGNEFFLLIITEIRRTYLLRRRKAKAVENCFSNVIAAATVLGFPNVSVIIPSLYTLKSIGSEILGKVIQSAFQFISNFLILDQ